LVSFYWVEHYHVTLQ